MRFRLLVSQHPQQTQHSAYALKNTVNIEYRRWTANCQFNRATHLNHTSDFNKNEELNDVLADVFSLTCHSPIIIIPKVGLPHTAKSTPQLKGELGEHWIIKIEEM